MDLVNTLQKINNIVPNLTVSQLLDIINIINEPKLTNMLLKGLKDINGVDFKQIALDIDSEFGSNGQIQTTLDFE